MSALPLGDVPAAMEVRDVAGILARRAARLGSWRYGRFAVWLAAAVTLGSGVVNLLSVIGPSLGERRALLKQFFPLEFLQLSRFLTLLAGFALVILSINILRRKKRALWAVLALAFLSVVFHLTKGLDYEEATFSAVVAALLFVTRANFTVESSVPNVKDSLLRLGAAAGLALGYGVIGFWLLDPRQFGMNLHLGDALRETLAFLSLAGDPMVAPQTRYAHWFLNSLYLITVTAIVYSLYALFRPVVYRYATHPHEVARAAEIVREHGRSPQDFFKTWPDKSIYFTRSRGCFVSYSVGANFAVVLGDPVGPAEEIGECVRAFAEYCRGNDWGIAFHQASPEFLPVYRSLGFRKLKIGDEAMVDLAGFAPNKLSKSVRYSLRLDKQGVHTRYFEPPVPDEVMAEIHAVSDEWLAIKGRRERQFTLGRFEPRYVRSTPVLAAYDEGGRMLAFVNLPPSPRQRIGTIDLMRRRTAAPNGIMDYLFVKLLLFLKERGVERFSLGLAPMDGFQETELAAREERAVHAVFQRLNFLFSYKGLRDYKAKFATSWEPRYAVYRSRLELPRLALALGKISEVREQRT